MKVFHLFIGKSSGGLLGLDNWCATSPVLLGALGGKNGWFRFCKILLSFSAADQCYHLERWRGSLYGCSVTPWPLCVVRAWFPPCPTRLLKEATWRLSSPWGWRMSWVGKGRKKKRGATLLACQGLSQLGKDSEYNCSQFCGPTRRPAAVLNWCFAEDASHFTWKVNFLSPQTLYFQAADYQIVISRCQTGISHLCCSVKVTGKRGYSLCWFSSKFFILP